MRKILSMIAVLLLIGYTAEAQRFGVKAGLNFNNLKDISENVVESYDNRTGFHMGIMYQAKIPGVGLAVQPELLYMRTGVKKHIPAIGSAVSKNSSMYTDNLILPVNIQWGLDLIMIRPYILAAPYLTYAIGKGNDLRDADWDDLNRFNYGIGAGVGIDIWRLQITGKYNWDFGTLAKDGAISADLDKAKMKGFQLSVGLFF